MSKAKEYYDTLSKWITFREREYIKTMNHKTIEDVKAKENDLLNFFCLFLEDQGYLDIDWKAEEPFAIDEFKKSNQYSYWKILLEKLKL